MYITNVFKENRRPGNCCCYSYRTINILVVLTKHLGLFKYPLNLSFLATFLVEMLQPLSFIQQTLVDITTLTKINHGFIVVKLLNFLLHDF